jgi:hypothetical protein
MALNFLYISKDKEIKIVLTKIKENIVKINFVLSSGIGFNSTTDELSYRPSDLSIEFLKIFSYEINLSGKSSSFSIFSIIKGLILSLAARCSIERPFESLASLMEDELFKKTIYVI